MSSLGLVKILLSDVRSVPTLPVTTRSDKKTTAGIELEKIYALEETEITDLMEVVKYLLANGASANARGSDGTTALMEAVRSGDVAVVKYLIDNGASVNARDDAGSTPLMIAAMGDNTEIAKLLLDSGASGGTYVFDNEGKNALCYAALNSAKMVKCLLESDKVDDDEGGDTITVTSPNLWVECTGEGYYDEYDEEMDKKERDEILDELGKSH